MQNLKINGVPTPYWCVVVEADARLTVTIRRLLFKSGESNVSEILLPFQNMELLGCITLSSMDEGVDEMVYMAYGFMGKQLYHESALSLLQHNQITLTPSTKAVVVKKIS